MTFLKKFLFFLLLLTSMSARAQVVTVDSAIGVAMRTHPVIRAGQFSVQAKQLAEKSALALPNPEVNVESPTGTFYAVGVMQSFEFPTVYRKQREAARAATALAQAGQQIQENDLRYTIRVLYLDAQTAVAEAELWQEQDSLYKLMANTANRQFGAGEIDFLQKTSVDNEAAKVQVNTKTAILTAGNTKLQLSSYVGISEIQALSQLYDRTYAPMQQPMNNPVIDYERQQKQVAASQTELAKSKTLPGFSLGYLNQGDRTTPLDYRFRASVGIPIWLGQNKASVAASRTEEQAAQARLEAQTHNIVLELQKAVLAAAAADAQIKIYETDILPRNQTLIETAQRMQAAGQIDYIALLRTIDTAFDTRRQYLEQLRLLHEANIKLLYLGGK